MLALVRIIWILHLNINWDFVSYYEQTADLNVEASANFLENRWNSFWRPKIYFRIFPKTGFAFHENFSFVEFLLFPDFHTLKNFALNVVAINFLNSFFDFSKRRVSSFLANQNQKIDNDFLFFFFAFFVFLSDSPRKEKLALKLMIITRFSSAYKQFIA